MCPCNIKFSSKYRYPIIDDIWNCNFGKTFSQFTWYLTQFAYNYSSWSVLFTSYGHIHLNPADIDKVIYTFVLFLTPMKVLFHLRQCPFAVDMLLKYIFDKSLTFLAKDYVYIILGIMVLSKNPIKRRQL